MGVTIAMVAVLTLSGLGVYVGLKTLENYSPGRKKIQKDLQKIKAEMQPYLSDLVPVGREELEQLTYNRVKQRSSKGITHTQRGVFTTVYHEALIAWTYKRYVAGGENALIYAKTTEHEFIYRIKKGSVEIVVDDLVLGLLDESGILMSGNRRKALAQINRSSESLALPVIVQEKEVGSLSNPRSSQANSLRAIYSMADMTKEEEKVFLSLSILEMVRNAI